MTARTISLRSVLRFPRVAQSGRMYTLTVDLRHDLPPEQWPYEREEYPLTCLLESLPLFEHRPLGEPTLIIHRFGGTYGEVRFLLKATDQKSEGRLRLLFVNESGMPVHTAEISQIRVVREPAVARSGSSLLGWTAGGRGLEQLLQAALPQKLEENKPVSPTLLVGLGGTGKEVLLRFRRMVVERFGSLAGLPFIQYMQLDTDSTGMAHEQYDHKGIDDPLHVEVRFSPAERIDMTIEGGARRYIEHLGNFPHIERWLPVDSQVVKLGNLGEGAGQIRMASRLGFFHAPNFARISSRLERCKGLFKEVSILQRSALLGFDFDPQGMQIFVIASFAGGTGGGTFLDMGFLLNQHFPYAERVGIFLLPDLFKGYAGGEGRMRANGYAALKELNHYSFGHSFRVDWDGKGEQVFPSPPFSTTYLIDAMNEAGLVIGSAGKEYDAYQMVAETLFQDYSSGGFSGLKRATRVNLIDFNLNVYSHNFLGPVPLSGSPESHRSIIGDTYPTRFGSFGLATIAFPTDRVYNTCAYRLALQILELWQREAVGDPLEELFFGILNHADVRFVQGRYERRGGGAILEYKHVEEALLVYESNSAQSIPSFLRQEVQNVRRDLEAAPSGQKAALLAEHRRRLDRFLAREDSGNAEEWGRGVHQIDANARMYLERVTKGIERRAEELANNSGQGVAWTLSLLRELKSLLYSDKFLYLFYFEDQAGFWRQEIQNFSAKLDQIQMQVARHERQLLFRAEDLRRDMDSLAGDEKSSTAGVLYSLLHARIMKQVARRGRWVCEEIDQFLGKDDPAGRGLIGRYYALQAGFEKLKDSLRSKERYFSTPLRSELTLSLYRQGDPERWYRKWMGEAATEIEITRNISSNIIEDVFHLDSAAAVLEAIQRTPFMEIEERMVVPCRQYFSSQPDQPEALRLLFDTSRLDAKQREETVRCTFDLAKVWLSRAERGLDHAGLPSVRSDQKPCLIGLDMTDYDLSGQFQDLVKRLQKPGDSPPRFLNIGPRNRGTIVIYNELAGVPAFSPSSVTSPNGLRQAYDRYPNKDELHIDKNYFQFSDLVPKTTKEARRYADSLKAFVFARILGVLRVREVRVNRDSLLFLFYFIRASGAEGRVEEVGLGSEEAAIEFLYRDNSPELETCRRDLLHQSEEVIHLLRDRQMLWLYALLLEFYIRLVYPPVVSGVASIAGLTFQQYFPEFAVLSRAQQNLPRMLPTDEDRIRLTAKVELLRGKPLSEDLTYEELAALLGPYCKPAGKFRARSFDSRNIGPTAYLDVLALDITKIKI